MTDDELAQVLDTLQQQNAMMQKAVREILEGTSHTTAAVHELVKLIRSAIELHVSDIHGEPKRSTH